MDRRHLIGLLRTFVAALEADPGSTTHLSFDFEDEGVLAIIAKGDEVSVEHFSGDPGDEGRIWRVT